MHLARRQGREIVETFGELDVIVETFGKSGLSVGAKSKTRSACCEFFWYCDCG